MILVLVTSANACKLYNYTKFPEDLSLLDVIKHDEAKLKVNDLVSDKAGGFAGASVPGGTHVPHTDPKEVELERFTKQIAAKLNKERTDHRLDKLILIAPPHVDGRLLNNLDKNVKQMICYNIKKDLINYTDDELLTFLKEHTRNTN